MKNFKRGIALILIAMMCFCLNVSAARVGDVINYALYTDIVARINGFDIDSYNVDGYTYIVAEDLANYGFNVVWNPYNKSLSISRNNGVSWINPGYVKPYVSPSQRGKVSHNILYTDIKTYINGSYVPSYNINGRTIIQFDYLGAFGGVVWDGANRVISVSVANLNSNKSNIVSYNNFGGQWGNIDGMYLAQHVDVVIKILSADDYNQTVTLAYKYTMGASGVWNGGKSDFSAPITVKYHQQNVKIQTGERKFEERVGYVTDMIEVMGSNKEVSSIIGNTPTKLCQFKLAIVDNYSLYNMSSSSGWTYYDDYKCTKIY